MKKGQLEVNFIQEILNTGILINKIDNRKKINRINETKSLFFEKNKKSQAAKIRNECEAINT